MAYKNCKYCALELNLSNKYGPGACYSCKGKYNRERYGINRDRGGENLRLHNIEKSKEWSRLNKDKIPLIQLKSLAKRLGYKIIKL